MTNAPDLEDIIIACERKVWDALVAGDKDADAAMLADSFLGIYPDGFAKKADHVGQLANGPSVTRYTMHDHHVRPLGATFAVLSYRAEFERVSASAPEAMYVTSIWENRNDTWVNILSQDTPA